MKMNLGLGLHLDCVMVHCLTKESQFFGGWLSFWVTVMCGLLVKWLVVDFCLE